MNHGVPPGTATPSKREIDSVMQTLSEERLQRGMTYDQYQQYFTLEAARAGKTPDTSDPRLRYLELNARRSTRIEKTYEVSEKLRLLVGSLSISQIWVVLTEPWCGDSAQSLPRIAKIAARNPMIKLRILLRDRNLDIMDQFLTGGTRSIPKLISLDSQGNELFRWGPRPKEAMDLFLRNRDAGLSKEEISEKLHLWYHHNRGMALEEEFLSLLSSL